MKEFTRVQGLSAAYIAYIAWRICAVPDAKPRVVVGAAFMAIAGLRREEVACHQDEAEPDGFATVSRFAEAKRSKSTQQADQLGLT